jgi:hypothetical protein
MRTRTRHTALVVAVAVVMTVAGGLGALLVLEQKAGSSPTIVADGPNFYQALGNLNSSVANASGGPWQLYSAVGIASQVSFSPNVISYYTLNASVVPNSCQATLSGLTMFNGTIPTFDGTFNSGTAPFWQFAYYSNVTKEILVGTDVLGATQVSSPFPLTSACVAAWYQFVDHPSQWLGQIYANSSLPVNSPEAAQVAWTHLGPGFADRWIAGNSPLAEMYLLGPAMLERTSAAPPGGNWDIDFLGCGLAGYTGDRGISYAGVTREGQYAGDFNGTANCALMSSGNPPGALNFDYYLPFTSPSLTVASTTQWVTAPYQVDATYSNGSMAFTDVWGLANWMTSWNLTNSSGVQLPLGPSTCDSWVPSISACTSDSSGWYAVVISPSGEWINSYGLQPSGSRGWAEPVTALVSHQQLVIVAPSSWNLTGDKLAVSSTASNCTVLGSLTF